MMRGSVRFFVFCLLAVATMWASGDDKRSKYPFFDYDTAATHEIKPHRRTVPLEGVEQGFHQFHLTLTVSLTGEVVDAKPTGDTTDVKYWPQVQDELRQWKFAPFEVGGRAVTAEVEEYVDLVPPERLPTRHVVPPALRSDSSVTITLERTGCFGTCPGYTVSVSTNGIEFDGRSFVVAEGRHTSSVSADEVRELARRFVAADFYSMDPVYRAGVTDNPTYSLSISIDGQSKEVEDYVGSWVGMPAVISELEDDVDTLARTDRWVKGNDGLVAALDAEHFNFHTYDAQKVLKESARRGQTATVRDLLEAGVPLQGLTAPKPKEPLGFESGPQGWLTSASSHPDVLQLLIDAGASENDQKDKDLALAGAAGAGQIEAARALIAYGANPNADLSKLTVAESTGGMTMQGPGAGSALIYAARSGNPEMVREILRYGPKLEMRNQEGKTALFVAAEEYRDGEKDGARAECVRLLAAAGADVSARDNDGNTPLHETFDTDVEEELLKLGTNVNARNNDGETPIFTTVDDKAIPLFIAHGADLTIRNNKGQTVLEAAKERGPQREKLLRQAIEKLNAP